ncbi:lipopolysaccharide assembly protein LapA domain-containing protein [Commensalibacter oyaizuii]|uniref:LapA family protein n=1 Tax=Commensalibacter oyaizuii TaxID=3043873 RepID=A0ABT6Q376_9PROT|nr:LapA family protein [Commensalibacter sp. TBRC 16381]MDI2091031.1 LapA family protein [Commensalibacter sp. TBRC 16381]
MLRFVIITVFLAVLVIFLLLNLEPVPMSFFMISWKTSVGIFALLLGIASFAIGALTVFISLVGQWRRARKAEQKMRDLEKQLSELQSKYIAMTQPQVTQPVGITPTSTATTIESSNEDSH